ncbi:MAG: hypothetical protein WDN45_05675 [Caulobacteraceae bacterium]
MTDTGSSSGLVIGLSAVIVAVQDGEGVVLTVRGHDEQAARPWPACPSAPSTRAGGAPSNWPCAPS